MYDIGRNVRQQLGDTQTEAERRAMLVQVSQQRWAEAEGADTAYIVGTPLTITEDSPAVAKEFYDYYYRTPRGQHPRSNTQTSISSVGALMQSFPVDHLDWISPRPLLLVAGSDAHSLYFSQDAYRLASEPRELYIVPGAGHVDLYDRVELIPWDKLDAFYTEHL